MLALRYVGKKGCSEQIYEDLLSGSHPERLIIDAVSAQANVTIRTYLDGSPVTVPMKGVQRELRDFAALTYIADEVTERVNSSDQWTRDFTFVFPTRNLPAWSTAKSSLGRTLSFLSGDRYQLDFVPLKSVPAPRVHRTVLPTGFDTVCLFSGGVDSLLGAYAELVAGAKVLLVAHQSSGGRAQTELFTQLRSLFGNKVRLVQSAVARSNVAVPEFPLPDSLELTHRTRSFLFLSLAINVAAALDIHRLLMPENGLIALNAPLQKSRLGSLSTRTAHPVYLRHFVEAARLLGAYTGDIKNPFLYESKTDMVVKADTVARRLLSRTVSCAHPSKYNDRGVRHCGYCVPCLYRRVAFVQAGIDEPGSYYRDVFRDLPQMTTETQVDFRALVGFAQRLLRTTSVGVDTVILGHGYFSPVIASQFGPHETVTLEPWRTMVTRWAQSFLGIVDQCSTRSTKQILGREVMAG